MSQVGPQFSISLEGSGPARASRSDDPFVHAGERLQPVVFATRSGTRWSAMPVAPRCRPFVRPETARARRRAEINGAGASSVRRPAVDRCRQDEGRRGWWGPKPAVPHAVFVLTHHTRPSIGWKAARVHSSRAPQEATRPRPGGRGNIDRAHRGADRRPRDFPRADSSTTMHVVEVPILPRRGVRLWDGRRGRRGALRTSGGLSRVGSPTYLHASITDSAETAAKCVCRNVARSVSAASA